MMTSSEGQTSRPRILVVEDEPSIRRFYERFCETYGYEAVLAPTGTAAFDILESGQIFDVVLLDVRLPGVSGRALWKQMELNRPELCARVIMVTGDILGETTQELLRESGRPYLEKPFSTQRLLDMIEAVLRTPDKKSDGGRRVGD